MSVKIVFPNHKGKIGTTTGTKVFLESGEELKDVYSVRMLVEPNDIIRASIEVAVSGVENCVVSEPVINHKPVSVWQWLKALRYVKLL